MDKPVHKIAINTKRYSENKLENQAIDLSLNVGYVSVLKKRSKSQKSCNDTLEDDDREFMLEVIKQVGCIPNYWESFITTNASLETCSKPNEVEEVYRLITNFKRVMSSYDPPCVEMKIPVTVTQQRDKLETDKERRLNGGKSVSYTHLTLPTICSV